MIRPEEIAFKRLDFDWDALEHRVDLVLAKPWVPNEQRHVTFPEAGDSDYIARRIVKKYKEQGWHCEVYGYSAVVFYAPKIRQSKPWWKFWS